MEAAARSSSSQVRLRAKRPSSSTTTAAQIDAPAVGIEAAAAGSASRRARRRRRTAQIGIPSRRAKTVRLSRPPVSNPPHPNWVVRRARSSSSPRPPSELKPPPLPRPDDRGGEKRARHWRDWSDLGDGPAGLIAQRVLAYDIADYVRFRAVCRPWRQWSTEPRSHSGLDRRFHPWRWTMLREKLAAPDRHCFLNTSTAECVQVDIPEFRDHKLLALTPEGLLVLVHDRKHKHIRLLNPLTRHLTQLPPLTTLLPPSEQRSLLEYSSTQYFNTYLSAWGGSGIADDDSTFVLCINRLSIIGMARPGDDRWRVLRYCRDTMSSAPVMIAGRFYCVAQGAVKMLKTAPPGMRPHLLVAAKLRDMPVTPMADSMHLINNCGEPMLLHRHFGPLTAGNQSGRAYDMYRVDLDTKTLVPVKSFGGGGAGRALFMGLRCSLSVSLEGFPSGSISADTMYLGFDFPERSNLDVGAYHLADGSVEVPCRLVQPHTLVDCLSLANTVGRFII